MNGSPYIDCPYTMTYRGIMGPMCGEELHIIMGRIRRYLPSHP
jgi:hypothetical protein